MNLMRYLFLAFLQGVTEFLPVSSSGHLVFFQTILGFEKPLLGFDIVLHLATVISVMIFLKRDLLSITKDISQASRLIAKGRNLGKIWQEFPYLRVVVFIFIALIPTIFLGIILLPLVEKMFASLKMISVSFFITGCVLFITKYVPKHSKIKKLKFLDAFLIGIAQAIAIVPGISRSGFTISCGIFRGLNKELAARFSFLLAIPTIAAAAIYQIKNGWVGVDMDNQALGLSFLVACLSGYIALVILSKMIQGAKFHYFSYYCWAMGIISLIFSLKG